MTVMADPECVQYYDDDWEEDWGNDWEEDWDEDWAEEDEEYDFSLIEEWTGEELSEDE